MSELDSLIGCKISLISHQDIRYDGTLFSINQAESSLVLKDVQAFGTENRVTDPSKIVPPTTQVLPFVTFPGQEIQDLYVHDEAPAAAPAPAPAPAVPTAPVLTVPEHKPKAEHKPRQHAPKTENAYPPRAPQEKKAPSPAAANVPPAAPVAATAAAKPAQKSTLHGPHGVGTGSHLLRLREKKVGESHVEDAQGEFNFEEALKTFNKEELQAEVSATTVAHKYVKDDFFDNFSAKEDGKKNRLTSHEERQLNQDTFGAIALTSGHRRGGRGRGRGGGRSYNNTGSGGRGGRGRGGPRAPAATVPV